MHARLHSAASGFKGSGVLWLNACENGFRILVLVSGEGRPVLPDLQLMLFV